MSGILWRWSSMQRHKPHSNLYLSWRLHRRSIYVLPTQTTSTYVTTILYHLKFIKYIAAPKPVEDDPCNPSPCGSNAQCNNGICTCLPEYQGDPYRGCRPECVLSSDCPRDKACVRNKCIDPCPGTCGQNAECSVVNHIPICTCLPGYTGSAFVICRPVESKNAKITWFKNLKYLF